MIAFHNSPVLKAYHLQRLDQHKAANNIVSGKAWDNENGGAVACTVHNNDYSQYESDLGVPAILAKIEEIIFNGLSKTNNPESKDFPSNFLSSVPVGSNLIKVSYQFIQWLLIDPTDGLINYLSDNKEAVSCIERIGALYDRKIKGDTVEYWEWKKEACVAAGEGMISISAAADAAGNLEHGFPDELANVLYYTHDDGYMDAIDFLLIDYLWIATSEKSKIISKINNNAHSSEIRMIQNITYKHLELEGWELLANKIMFFLISANVNNL